MANAYLFLWNPDKDPQNKKNLDLETGDPRLNKQFNVRWICGSKKPQPGDIALLKRTGTWHNGLIAKGVVTKSANQDRGDVMRVELRIDSILPIGREISKNDWTSNKALASMSWHVQSSGISIPPGVLDAIEALWLSRAGKSKSVSVNSKQLEPQTPEGNLSPNSHKSESNRFQRDSKVKNHVLRLADGKCEYCGKSAPFNDDNNKPYLEVHHVVALSDLGPDTIDNTVALCPNCHRAIEMAADRKSRSEKLYRTVHRLIKHPSKTKGN